MPPLTVRSPSANSHQCISCHKDSSRKVLGKVYQDDIVQVFLKQEMGIVIYDTNKCNYSGNRNSNRGNSVGINPKNTLVESEIKLNNLSKS